jgi:gamma-glutamylcyclotransferase (GGCT)/AIG2-like uncharacterized protein YtfP
MPLPYLAYGSNLLTTRLTARCPSARVIGVARLPGHSLDFSKYGRDGTGKATITAGKGDVAGVLFDIAAQDIPALDSAEGAGTHYAKVEVTLADGRLAFTYSALMRAGGLAPFAWYLALIRAGRREHGLALHDLAAITPLPDPQPDRATFQQARDALRQAGYADWRTAL